MKNWGQILHFLSLSSFPVKIREWVNEISEWHGLGIDDLAHFRRPVLRGGGHTLRIVLRNQGRSQPERSVEAPALGEEAREWVW